MGEKSSSLALILSFLFTGVGIIYLGNTSKGVILLAAGILFNILGMFVFGFFHYLSIITWLASLYLTYNETKNIKKAEPVKYVHRNYRDYL